MNSKIK